jgi:glycosyltransferase involved in cell wall biosynthesis
VNILFNTYGINQGGGISNVFCLLEAYLKRYPEDQIDIICSLGAPLEKLGNHSNCKIVAFPNDRLKELRRVWLNTFGIKRIIRKYKSNIIWSLNLGPYIKTRLPQVLSLHNSYQVCRWSYRSSHPKSAMAFAILRCFSRISIWCTDGIITQTPIMAELTKKFSMNRPIAIIPKSVESDKDIADEPLPNHVLSKICTSNELTFIFLYVATLIPHKNHLTIIKALNILKNEAVKTKLVLTITKDELLQVGGELAEQLVESGYIVPIGWISKNQLRALYSICDACVMPSVLESLSSAHLEAMQWGRPQINSNLRYSHDLCNKAAIYAEPYDFQDWATKMKLVIFDGELRARLASSGKEQMYKFPETWSNVAEVVRKFLLSFSIKKKEHINV